MEHDPSPARRQAAILDIIKREKTVNVTDLSRRLFINPATIRRDLTALSKTGLVSRNYGGAVFTQGLDSEIPFPVRKKTYSEEKNQIARTASELIRDGDTVFLDSSSTVEYMLPYIKCRKNLKIVTNGVQLAVLLSGLYDCTVYSTGGRIRTQSLSYVGAGALSAIASFHFQKSFFSCRGVSISHGLTDSNDDEAALRQTILERSSKAYLLADHSKFNTASFCFIAKPSKLTAIITDRLDGEGWEDIPILLPAP